MNLIQKMKRRMGSDGEKAKAPSREVTPTGTIGSNSNSSQALPVAAGAAPGNAPKSGAAVANRSSISNVKPMTDASLQHLPSLRETPVSERTELFRKKLQFCSILYDFNQQTYVEEKEQKRLTLMEIVEYVNNTRSCFNDSIMQDVVSMVSMNVFRSLPPTTGRNPNSIYDPEDDEPAFEPSWPHLQIVYEFFLRFVVSNDVDPKVAKRFVDQTFVLRLLDLFDAEDPRERDYLKTILHRIYGKFMSLRSFIRKAIQHLFFKIIYECEFHNGIAELLEILGSIINGFALPLKEEHKQFLAKFLIPLHKVKTLSSFHLQLTYCITQYVDKDPRLAEPLILGILRFWPVTNTPKEVLFLNEIDEILELTQPPEFRKVQLLLFKRIARCIMSPHFQVAERALFLWNTEYVVKLINQNRHALFPIVIGALYQNSKHHWNSTVHGLTYNVLKLLMEADPPLFDDCSSRHKSDTKDGPSPQEEEKAKKWERLAQNFEKNGKKQSTEAEKLAPPK